MMPRKRIDQLGSDPHPISRLADAAFQHVPYTQFLPHLLDLHRLPLVAKRRVAGNDEHLVDLGESRDDFLG